VGGLSGDKSHWHTWGGIFEMLWHQRPLSKRHVIVLQLRCQSPHVWFILTNVHK